MTELLEGRPVRLPNYRMRWVDGEFFLVHPSDDRMMCCNETASIIWQLCTGEFTISEMIDLLAEAFPDADTIEKDVERTLTEFMTHGVIRFRSALDRQ